MSTTLCEAQFGGILINPNSPIMPNAHANKDRLLTQLGRQSVLETKFYVRNTPTAEIKHPYHSRNM
jgi:hypothetical protein